MDILGTVNLPTWLVLLILAVVLAYVYSTWTYDHFIKMGVPGPKPIPMIGNSYQMFKYGHVKDYDRSVMEKYGKIAGIYEGRSPVLLVSDPEMIKQIMVKEFNSFVNRDPIVELDEKYWRTMLTGLNDDHWRHVRRTLTPCFTTGKIKRISSHLNKCADILLENLIKRAKAGENVDIKEQTASFGMDIIARIAFGIELNTQNEPDHPFIKHARKIMQPSSIGMLLAFAMPYLIKPLLAIGFDAFGGPSKEYFYEISKKLLRERNSGKNSEQYADFMQLMINAQVEPPTKEDLQDEELMTSVHQDQTGTWTNKGLTEEEIIGNMFVFFLAGYETTASTMTDLLYEVALSPEVQERILKEIDEVTGSEEVITPDMVSKMTYLDQCLMESMRLHTVAFRTNRKCTQTITLGGITIPKGQRVDLCIDSLHRDPEVYPEPEKFDPDRFSPEARAARNPVFWMPFGYGPRNCIGMRLAMMEVKMSLARVFQKLRFKPCDETDIPLQYKMTVLTRPIKLKVEIRDK